MNLISCGCQVKHVASPHEGAWGDSEVPAICWTTHLPAFLLLLHYVPHHLLGHPGTCWVQVAGTLLLHLPYRALQQEGREQASQERGTGTMISVTH